MDKIEVGEYVRIKSGEICKVLGIRPEMRSGNRIYGHKSYYLENKKYCLTKACIIKHSFNILDLIEVGDIIIYNSNYLGRQIKMEVDYIRSKNEDYKWGEGYVNTVLDEYIMIDDIKSIVTKEQFERIQYVL
jgi:hypothetical protein